jgi:hypothetical protein
MDKPMLNLTFRAKPETVKKLLQIARQSGLSKSEILRRILNKEVMQKTK